MYGYYNVDINLVKGATTPKTPVYRLPGQNLTLLTFQLIKFPECAKYLKLITKTISGVQPKIS